MDVPDAMRRAFTQVKNGRPRPVMVEIPVDVMRRTCRSPGVQGDAAHPHRAGPKDVAEAARVLVAAERPVIYAGQGVHYAQAWPQPPRGWPGCWSVR